ncbi:hypothetical protein NT6N_20370 [Oceaniferula spumae]|uniref:Uncharacterized protein n=1 Tax=Oceaniferula spumae TaxID=2979115 RepID=A0AAT9FLK2_9BACT
MEINEPPEQDRDLYKWIKRLLTTGASMASASLKLVWVAMACSVASWGLGIYVLGWDRDYHWLLTSGYGLLALLPVLVLAYYHWMLSSLREAPAQISSIKETIHRFREEHPAETKEVLSQKFASLGKWRTYRLIGKVLKDIIASAGDVSGIAGNIKTVSAMGNPVFWITLVFAVVGSFLFSTLALVLFLLILTFGS